MFKRVTDFVFDTISYFDDRHLLQKQAKDDIDTIDRLQSLITEYVTQLDAEKAMASVLGERVKYEHEEYGKLSQQYESVQSTCKWLDQEIMKLRLWVTDLQGENADLRSKLEASDERYTILSRETEAEYTAKCQQCLEVSEHNLILIESNDRLRQELEETHERNFLLTEENTGLREELDRVTTKPKKNGILRKKT